MAAVDFIQLKERSLNSLKFLQGSLDGLDVETLSWKAAENKWSILEVVGHLNQVYEIYFPLFENALDNANPEVLQTGDSIQRKTTLLGKLSIYSMKPKKEKIRFKMKTFDFFEPKVDQNYPDATIETFLNHHNRFNKLMTGLSQKQVTNVKMGTSLGDKVKFYIVEAIEFLIAHEERHMVQISNILQLQTELV